jgi:pantoate--beta-alanine ligase
VNIDFGYLAQPMEGAHRPGHFEGMAQVVRRLLDIVQPDELFMGQKDFQQFVIVRHLLEQLRSPIELTMCPTVREADGLAMSSRNMRLAPEQRALAPLIFQTLENAKVKMATWFAEQLKNEAMTALSVPGMVPEYFEIADGRTLRPVEVFEDHEMVVACTAVRVGEVRLIDNLVMKQG